MGSRMRLTTFRELADKGELGIVLGRLMMALNDFGIANDGLESWHAEQPKNRQHRQTGAKMYFVRMLIAHVYEALLIINKIKSDPALMKAVERCDPQTRKSFEDCVSIIGTEEYKRMKEVRNNISFHYLTETVRVALEAQSKKNPEAQFSLSLGHATLDWYCEPGDRLVDSVVVRQIFQIPEDANVRTEVDKIVGRLQEIGEQLAEFAGYFIFQSTGKG